MSRRGVLSLTTIYNVVPLLCVLNFDRTVDFQISGYKVRSSCRAFCTMMATPCHHQYQFCLYVTLSSTVVSSELGGMMIRDSMSWNYVYESLLICACWLVGSGLRLPAACIALVCIVTLN